MKILSRPNWEGARGTCRKCGAIVEMEKGDKPIEVRVTVSSTGGTYTNTMMFDVECQFCKTIITCFKFGQ